MSEACKIENGFLLLTIQKHFCLYADIDRAKEVALRYRNLFEFVDFSFVLAISADVNGPSSSVDYDDSFISL